MPQLDVSTYVSQLFWLGVCFLALYLILSYIVLPRISSVLEARDQSFEGKINKASTYREEAENLLAEYEATLIQAKERAQQEVKSTAQSLSSEIERKKKDFLDKLDEKLRRAEQDLYRTRVEVSKDIRPAAKELAGVILQKLTGHAHPLETSSRIGKKG